MQFFIDRAPHFLQLGGIVCLQTLQPLLNQCPQFLAAAVVVGGQAGQFVLQGSQRGRRQGIDLVTMPQRLLTYFRQLPADALLLAGRFERGTLGKFTLRCQHAFFQIGEALLQGDPFLRHGLLSRFKQWQHLRPEQLLQRCRGLLHPLRHLTRQCRFQGSHSFPGLALLVGEIGQLPLHATEPGKQLPDHGTHFRDLYREANCTIALRLALAFQPGKTVGKLAEKERLLFLPADKQNADAQAADSQCNDDDEFHATS